MTPFFIALAALAAAALLFAVYVLLLFRLCVARLEIPARIADRYAFYAPWTEEMRADTAWFFAQGPQAAALRARDGLRLAGHYLPRADARGAVLLLHGYRGTGAHDMAGAARFYYEQGYSVLLPDQRAHGESEGRYVTFGVWERYDCLDWANWLAARAGGAPILLDGVSMGAASALMATGLPLPDTVRAVVADCGFTTPRAIFAQFARSSLHFPPTLLLPPVERLTRRLARFGLDDASAPEALARSALPVLLVHGAADSFIPPAMSEENCAAARGWKKLVLVPGAEHGVSWYVDRAGCARELAAFLGRFM